MGSGWNRRIGRLLVSWNPDADGLGGWHHVKGWAWVLQLWRLGFAWSEKTKAGE